MCAAKSNIIQQFNQTTLFLNWNIYQDPQRGPKLQLYRFDGAPLSPMYLISTTPNMLPTTTLTQNVTVGQVAPSGSSRTAELGITAMVGVLGATVLVAVSALL